MPNYRLNPTAAIALKTIIQAKGLIGTNGEIAAALNAPTEVISVRQPVVRRALIKMVLISRGKLGTLLASTSPYGQLVKAMFVDPDFETIDLDDTTAWKPLETALIAETNGSVSGNTGIVKEDIDVVQSLGDTTVQVSILFQHAEIGLIEATQDDVAQALSS